jgi:hypothetical protein
MQQQPCPTENTTVQDEFATGREQRNGRELDQIMANGSSEISVSPMADMHAPLLWQQQSPDLQWNGSFDLLINAGSTVGPQASGSKSFPDLFVPAGSLFNADLAMSDLTFITYTNCLGTEDLDESNTSDDEPTHRLAATSGGLTRGQDGRRHYYGASSSLRILRDSPLSLYQPTTLPSLQNRGENSIKRSGLHWEGDERLENHLSTLYFTWHKPMVRRRRLESQGV